MRVFFAEQNDDGWLSLKGQDAKHVSLVLRMKEGDKLDVVLPSGDIASCVIEHIGQDEVLIRSLSYVPSYTETKKKFILIQGIPKGQKMDFIVEKCTELGFSEFRLAITKHSIVRDSSEGKLERWRKLAHAAAKQSGRSRIPEVFEAEDLDTALRDVTRRGALVIFLWEHEDKKGLPDIEAEIKAADEIVIVVGPEGGFSTEEARSAEAMGAHLVNLGPRVLRTETAPITAGSAVLYIAGELQP